MMRASSQIGDIMRKVAIIMGSKSDLPVVQKGFPVLKELGIEFDVHVYSAHRTGDAAIKFAKEAGDAGYAVIIACAGMAAHLAGVLAANTVLPVIGVPISSTLGGLDALLSTVQMPSGIPVATVAVDGSRNACYLAAQILAVGDPQLSHRLELQRMKMSEAVLKENEEVEQGFRV